MAASSFYPRRRRMKRPLEGARDWKKSGKKSAPIWGLSGRTLIGAALFGDLRALRKRTSTAADSIITNSRTGFAQKICRVGTSPQTTF